MNLADGGGHHTGQRRRRQGRRQPGGQKGATHCLRRPGEKRVHLRRSHVDVFHHGLGARAAGTAEPAKDLLCAVADEERTDDKPRTQASNAHVSSLADPVDGFIPITDRDDLTFGVSSAILARLQVTADASDAAFWTKAARRGMAGTAATNLRPEQPLWDTDPGAMLRHLQVVAGTMTSQAESGIRRSSRR